MSDITVFDPRELALNHFSSIKPEHIQWKNGELLIEVATSTDDAIAMEYVGSGGVEEAKPLAEILADRKVVAVEIKELGKDHYLVFSGEGAPAFARVLKNELKKDFAIDNTFPLTENERPNGNVTTFGFRPRNGSEWNR